jgi:sulfate adenylyltransferase large subunit
MTARPRPGDFALDSFLRRQEENTLLRIVACGSVDHGKSTLIGRLLYESNLLFEDQLDALERESRRNGTQGGELDFALVLDGLQAEIEQKITIDVAYRFFATERRKFIIADAPGHEHYTRNMATGASSADVALILVSASAGLTRQTKRHSLIVSMLGVRHLVLAVNKMDLVGWSEEKFRAIEDEFRDYVADLGVDSMVAIPIAARSGDNVVVRSRNTEWYSGATLLEHFEDVAIVSRAAGRTLRMPVQWVNRPDADFRGYSGTIAAGDAYPGMAVQILPSGEQSRIARIVTFDRDLDRAAAGRSVTLTLANEVDASRGEVIAALAHAPVVTDRFGARIFWMGREPLVRERRYLLKLATSHATASIAGEVRVLDLDTRATAPAGRLAANEIGQCVLRLDRVIAVDTYADCKETGSFILIDGESYDTVGMGIVEDVAAQSASVGLRERLRRWFATRAAALTPPAGAARETHLRSIVKAVSWRATGSLDTFLLTLIITGSSMFAGSIAAAETITKIAFYYFHERIWSLVSWGRR